jgi:hypothetical protein
VSAITLSTDSPEHPDMALEANSAMSGRAHG